MRQSSALNGSIAVGLVILAFTGCDDAPLSTALVKVPDPHLSHVPRHGELPFRLNGEAVLVHQDFAPGFPGGKSDFGGRCSAPSDFVISFSATGNTTHLGEVTADLEHCSQIDFQMGTSTLGDGTEVITAANGDELWATYRSADMPVGQFDELVQFSGGTGRFESASGEGLARAVCFPATRACPVYEVRGVITYGASDRSR